MNETLSQKLKDKYPHLLQKITSFDCADGWFVLIDSLCGIIDHQLKSSVPLELHEAIYVAQIKEKFGGLRFYMNQETPFISGAIALAEYMSDSICETCGAPGRMRTIHRWYSVLCEPCCNDRVKQYKTNDPDDSL